MFSREFCDIFKNTFLTEHLWENDFDNTILLVAVGFKMLEIEWKDCIKKLVWSIEKKIVWI